MKVNRRRRFRKGLLILLMTPKNKTLRRNPIASALKVLLPLSRMKRKAFKKKRQ